jgi:hypothetical protein
MPRTRSTELIVRLSSSSPSGCSSVANMAFYLLPSHANAAFTFFSARKEVGIFLIIRMTLRAVSLVNLMVCSMFDLVSFITARSIVADIREVGIGLVVVVVTYMHARGVRSKESKSYKIGYLLGSCSILPGKLNEWITSKVQALLEYPLSAVKTTIPSLSGKTANLSPVGYFIETFVPRDWKPAFVVHGDMILLGRS